MNEIENIPLPDDSVDVIISNCVINLSADKHRVLRETYRLVKPGGRFTVSDIVVRHDRTNESVPSPSALVRDSQTSMYAAPLAVDNRQLRPRTIFSDGGEPIMNEGDSIRAGISRGRMLCAGGAAVFAQLVAALARWEGGGARRSAQWLRARGGPTRRAGRDRQLPAGLRAQCVDHVRETVAALKNMDPDYVIPMHCTGEKFIEIVQEEMPGRFIRSDNGSRFTSGV